jgi:hypothetical protein
MTNWREDSRIKYLKRSEMQDVIPSMLGGHYVEKAIAFFCKFADQEHQLSHFDEQFNVFEKEYFSCMPSMIKMMMDISHPNRIMNVLWVVKLADGKVM